MNKELENFCNKINKAFNELHKVIEDFCGKIYQDGYEDGKYEEKKKADGNKYGFAEYSDIKDTYKKLLDKGYTKSMLETVLEQMKEDW